MQIKKRNGSLEDYDVDKIHKVLEWATDGINGVSFSEIAMNARLSLFDGISSKDIHKILIKSSSDLISEDNPNYQPVVSQ